MKLSKLIRHGVFYSLTVIMICTVISSCTTDKKNPVQIENDVMEDSTFIDSNAKYGRLISHVNDFKGSQMFLNNCDYGRYLVDIEAVEIYRNPENGVVQIGQLSGNVVWGEVPWEVINVDRREQFTELGWESMNSLKEFIIKDTASEAYIKIDRMNMSILKVNGYDLLVFRDMEGSEHPTNSKISIAPSELDDIDCIAYVEWNCSNIACSGSCEDVGGDCNCTGSFGFCSYTLNIKCMKINCKKTCERYWPIGGLAWCNCE